MDDLKYLRSTYPPIISSEQLRKILHVSKRKCAWMLQNGLIPCIDSHKKTRRYMIELEDVILFLIECEDRPPTFPKSWFTTGCKPLNIPPKCAPNGFRAKLEDKWHKVPDVLTIKDVAKLTGYTDNAVDRWIVKGSLRSVLVQTGLIVSKVWLVDFYCGEGYSIAKKSDKHIRLIKGICG